MREESGESVRTKDIIEDLFAILVLSAMAAGAVFLLGVVLGNVVVASSFVIFFSLACSILFLSDKIGRVEKRLSKVEERVEEK